MDYKKAIEELAEKFPLVIQQSVIDAANIVIEEIRSRAPKGKGPTAGQLKRSLRARIVDGQFLGIAMVDYGWYQNYGVIGVNNKAQVFGLPKEIAQNFGVSTGYNYKFGASGNKGWGAYYSGINGQLFYRHKQDMDRIVQIINQNLEL